MSELPWIILGLAAIGLAGAILYQAVRGAKAEASVKSVQQDEQEQGAATTTAEGMAKAEAGAPHDPESLGKLLDQGKA